ncbi:MAG: M48 family metallopeptidase [Treponemataceae bacterium]|nr:M48 family metallopeptidase [Treponemataceae bacterium]
MERVILNGLNTQSYEHTWDIKAKKGLESVKYLSTLVKLFNKYFSDNIVTLNHYLSYLEISRTQYKRIYEIFVDCCQILDIPVPPLFLIRNAAINAYTTGITTPLVCVTSGCIELLSEGELRFVLGHELGHIKSEHMLNHSLVNFFNTDYGNDLIVGTLPSPVGSMAVVALHSALYKWYRMSELTADRVGLLCTQNISDSVSALSKFAGFLKNTDDEFNLFDFLKHSEKIYKKYNEKIEGLLLGTAVALGDQTHPYTVLRVCELNKWYNEGAYDRIVYGKEMPHHSIEEVVKLPGFKKCQNCGFDKVPLSEFFCPECGRPASAQ